MYITNSSFTLFGELKDQKNEARFLQSYWARNKTTYFIAYNTCCILLLFAGIFFDFNRVFYIGSATQLLILRAGLVISGLLMIPLYRKKKRRPKSLELYCFFLMSYSALIIGLLTIWTKGNSFTLMPGILIMIVSFYIALPAKFSFSFIPSMSLFLIYCFCFNYNLVGLKAHYYMCFMLFSINAVLIHFKIQNAKNMRKEFLAKEYFKEVSHAKNTLLSIIGHDLKNPLTIITNKLYFIRKDIEKENYNRALNHIDKVDKSVTRVSSLLQNLLEWAISDMTSTSQIKQRENIQTPCLNAIQYCEEQASSKSIELNFDIDEHDMPIDSNKIETIIRNIITNSIKYSPANKKILVKGKISQDHYLISIKDQGIGMNKDLIDKIKNGKNHTSTNGTQGEKGTGVGLKLVNQFIQFHQGTFDISSKEGEGSEFIIKFPISNSVTLEKIA